LGYGDYIEMALNYAFTLYDSCFPLIEYYPGSDEIFVAMAEISSAAGGSGHQLRLRNSLNYTLKIDFYGTNVMSRIISCYASKPSMEEMNFWLVNGGPVASATLFSPDGQLNPEGQTAGILSVSGAE
jgi:hypothetical protein